MIRKQHKFFEADGNQSGQDKPAGGDPQDKGGDPELLDQITYLKNELQTVISARDEAKNKLRAYDEEKASKAGEYQSIIDTLKAEKAEIEKQLNDALPIVEKHKSYEQKRVEAIKTDLGERWKPEFEGFSLDQLESVASLIKPNPALHTDKGNGQPASVKLTEDEKKRAKEMFPYAKDPEKLYSEYKQKRGLK